MLSPATGWLRRHDPGLTVSRRAARAALVMPGMFALADQVIANPVVALFTAFGCFVMLLLVDFSGPIRDRLADQAALAVSCAALICLGTLVSQTTWLATVVMAAIAFGVLFAGVLSSVLAGSSTALLLAMTLGIAVPGAASSIPDRIAGWGLAGGACLLAVGLLWPAPARNPLRGATIAACRALADRLRAEVGYRRSATQTGVREEHRAAVARGEEAVQGMLNVFLATPYRPSGLSTDGRSLLRIVDELRWLSEIVLRSAPSQDPPLAAPRVCAVKLAAADVLEQAAGLLERPAADPAALRSATQTMHARLGELEQATIAMLPGEEAPSGGGIERSSISALDLSFRAQELSFVAEQIAANSDFSAAAARRSWLDRLLGRLPDGVPGALVTAQRRAAAHVQRSSVWLHNSLRGAVALGLAVLVADLSSVQHGFWVVFGTLAVLRSTALSTGQNVLRALLGTVAGFAVGGVLVYLIGSDTTVLWALLPVAVLVAGMAPATISFAAGQAAFTVTLLILFNIIVPAGWKIGLLRVEDVALGCAVSLVVGLLFWPRGGAAALGRALGGAYQASARYLAEAVSYGVSRCDPSSSPSTPPRRQSLDALSAALRLDDTFRWYLADHGSKPAHLAEITELVTGVTGVRLAADAVLDLWSADGAPAGGAPAGDRSRAGRELAIAAARTSEWYERLAASLSGDGKVPEPLAADDGSNQRLLGTVRHDLRDRDGRASATGVRVIWTGDHLDAVRRLQEALVAPAQAALPGAGIGG